MTQGEVIALAGVNGAGKSSILGEWITEQGGAFYNPDERARQLLEQHPGMSQEEADEAAWLGMAAGLQDAIAAGAEFYFETTLGGNTITSLLLEACEAGLEVRIAYAGLESVELHLQRIQQRVVLGGHDIPEQLVRKRYESSRRNLIKLLPHLTDLRVFDNSEEDARESDQRPDPLRVLQMHNGRITECLPLGEVPEWAKPIVYAAIISDVTAS